MEASRSQDRQPCPVERIVNVSDGLATGLPLVQQRSTHQRVLATRRDEECRLGLGVPHLMAWLLAGTDRVHRLGARTDTHCEHHCLGG